MGIFPGWGNLLVLTVAVQLNKILGIWVCVQCFPSWPKQPSQVWAVVVWELAPLSENTL